MIHFISPVLIVFFSFKGNLHDDPSPIKITFTFAPDFTALYKYLFDEIDNYAKGHIASVILILAEAQYQDAFAVDKEIHVMATMIKIINELK